MDKDGCGKRLEAGKVGGGSDCGEKEMENLIKWSIEITGVAFGAPETYPASTPESNTGFCRKHGRVNEYTTRGQKVWALDLPSSPHFLILPSWACHFTSLSISVKSDHDR